MDDTRVYSGLRLSEEKIGPVQRELECRLEATISRECLNLEMSREIVASTSV